MVLIRLVVLVGIVAGVIARLMTLSGDHLSDASSATLDRDVVLAKVSQGAADAFCYSADAVILLGVGVDGKPGQADKDDNIDGVVDDSRETGAVPSDDRCLAPADEGYEETFSAPGTVVISRGAYVPCTKPEEATRWRHAEYGWVIGD